MPSRDDNRSLSTEQRWIPPSSIRRDALTPESRNDVIFRKVRGLLNKLTPEKFAKLSNDLLNLELNSDVILKGVIFLIFEKALDEPKYSSMYAQLCKRLSEEAAQLENEQKLHGAIGSSRLAGGGGHHGGTGPTHNNGNNHNNESAKVRSNDNTFTRLLLNKCRFEFENRSKAHEAFERQDGELSPEDEERRQMVKRKMLGNIKFIGELGKLEIISNSILHKCIQQLLDKRRGGSRGDPAEDIECLCQIMRTCGRILDTDKGQQLMEQYFKRMKSLAKSQELPLRIRFMLLDVIELRRDGWVPRKATSTEGPMPINQIRNDNDDVSQHRSSGGQGVLGRHSEHNFYGGRNSGGPPSNRLTDHHAIADQGRPGSDLFRRMGRVSMNDFSSIISISSSDFGALSPFGPTGAGGPNGFSGGGGRDSQSGGYNNQRGGRGNNQQNQGFYGQNRQQNNYHNQHGGKQQHNSGDRGGHNYNNNGNKEQAPRFNKNKILIGPPEEVSLRPSANSMTYKQPNIIPQLPIDNGIDLFPGRGMPETTLMRAATIRKQQQNQQQQQQSQPPASSAVNLATIAPKAAAPTPAATSSIVIKQGPLDKREKARERKDKGLTKEEVMKKVHAMLDEHISQNDVDKAVQALKELKIPERFLRYAVLSIYSNCLERNEAERTLAADLVAQLRKDNIISSNQFHDGWKELVTSMADKDVPCVLSHIALFTARAIVDQMLQLNDLASVTENGQHYPLFLLTLQQLHKSQGKQVLSRIFNESKINLISQLPEAEKTKERLGEILEDRDLTFLYPLLRIQGDMGRQLEADPSPTTFYKWIKEKLEPSHHSDPAFINALIAVLLKYITRETTFPEGVDPNDLPSKALQEKELALLGKYQRMLQTLLPTIESQVTAVHSLQVFCYSHKFPKGMLLRWFIALYDLSIIDEDAFMRWKEDINDAYPGKGDALFQVNAWLTWLADQPSESEEDDEEEEEKW
ncbi:hypothetical protein TKK_0004224 [Trichogramma kaykai]|uniref:Eukaryotic translation initiation factor 4 gamma 2 n=1 Tax=Trichogramma kaykai TaxID=54128 RepID=A0ABD2XMH9_9HYME